MLFVATCNPVSLYSMTERGDGVQLMELYDVFPRTISGVWQPLVTVAPLGGPLDGHVVLHEEQSNTVLHVDMTTGAVRRLVLSPDAGQPVTTATSWWSSSKEQKGSYRMCREFAHQNWLLFFREDGNQLEVLDVLEGRVHSIGLPISVRDVRLVAEDRWLLTQSHSSRKYLLTKPLHTGAEDSGVCQLHTISEDAVTAGHGATSGEECAPVMVSREPLPDLNLSAALGQRIASPSRLLADDTPTTPAWSSDSLTSCFKRPVSLTSGEGVGALFSRGGGGRGVGGRKEAAASGQHASPPASACISANQVVRAPASYPGAAE
ncbi:hypothetical protein CRUP_020890, partial [Coryphaenoides rupestris]